MTHCIRTLCIMTLSITTLIIVTLSIMTLSIMTLSITTLSIRALRIPSLIWPCSINVAKNIVVLIFSTSPNMQNIIMLSVIILNVLAPFGFLSLHDAVTFCQTTDCQMTNSERVGGIILEYGHVFRVGLLVKVAKAFSPDDKVIKLFMSAVYECS
jgi:hypothetical protein